MGCGVIKEREFDLNGLPVFAALVEAGSFTAAAERLGCTKTRVSLQIRRLETRLGVALFHRTTRQVHLTQAGESLYRDCRPLLEGLWAAVGAVESDDQELRGELRLTAPEDYVAKVLGPATVAFAERHPSLGMELRSGDSVSDMVKEGIDLAIRVGWLQDSTLRSSQLGTFEQHVVAAPDYLARHGVPEHPRDLLRHSWVAFTPLASPLTWTFHNGRQQHKVHLHARLKANASSALVGLLTQGAGLSVVPDVTAAVEQREGRLVRVLEDWSLPAGGIHAVYPPGRHVPAKVRAFVAFLRDYLNAPSRI